MSFPRHPVVCTSRIAARSFGAKRRRNAKIGGAGRG